MSGQSGGPRPGESNADYMARIFGGLGATSIELEHDDGTRETLLDIGGGAEPPAGSALGMAEHEFWWQDANEPPILPQGFPERIRARAYVRKEDGFWLILDIDRGSFLRALAGGGATSPPPRGVSIDGANRVDIEFVRDGEHYAVGFFLA